MPNGEKEELGLEDRKIELDFSIDRSRGSAQGYGVFVYGTEESIGLEFTDLKALVDFMLWLQEEPQRLEEFMPDSDWRKVTGLFVD